MSKSKTNPLSDDLDSETAAKVISADIVNIVKKVKAGKPLMESERRIVREHLKADEPAEQASQTTFSIRWTIEKAAAEWDINPRTLSKNLKTDGILAGPDGKWSTKQINAAVNGDVDAERRANLREDTALKTASKEREMIELAKEKGKIISDEAVTETWGNIAIAVRRIILLSKLTNAEKDAILRELHGFNVADLGKQQNL